MITRTATKLLAAAALCCALPGALLAQDNGKAKAPKNKEQVIITHSAEGKTVIEIDGDNIKVNGKDYKDLKDGEVNVIRMKMPNVRALTRAQGGWNMDLDFDNDRLSLFHEDANRAMLGVMTDNHDEGVEVESVSRESAAEKAGLKKGDIITRIGDKKTEDPSDVTEAIRARKPGDKVDITVLRDGKEQKLSAELGKWRGVSMNAVTVPGFPRTPEVYAPHGREAMVYGMSRPRLGLQIQDTDDGKGVKVLEVDEESNAAKAGLQEGDLITHINDQEVTGTDVVTRALRADREKYTHQLRIQRNGKSQTVTVNMPRRLKTADL